MAKYACTKCLQWFRFDELSEDQQICSECLTKVSKKDDKKRRGKTDTATNCKFCQTDLKNKNIVDKDICDRCEKNFQERGEPGKCSYCKLQSAFIGDKCQRCSSSLKKYGPPINCHKCNLKAAFDHSKARKDLRKGKRKHANSNDQHTLQNEAKKHKTGKGTSPNSCDQVWKELFGEDKDYRKTNKPERARSEERPTTSNRSSSRDELRKKAQHNSRQATEQRHKDRGKGSKHNKSSLDSKLEKFEMKIESSQPSEKRVTPETAKSDNERSTPRLTASAGDSKSDNESSPTPSMLFKTAERMRNGVPPVSDNNIVMVTKLRDEISSLKKQLTKKDQLLLEKDKQISRLKVDHLQEERSLQAKLRSQEDEFLKSKEAAMAKNHELLKKISQLSKGKA